MKFKISIISIDRSVDTLAKSIQLLWVSEMPHNAFLIKS